jgi:hypothetical protein
VDGVQSRQGAYGLICVRDGETPPLMKVVFLAPAQNELDDAVASYNRQAVGLGQELLDELDRAIRRRLSVMVELEAVVNANLQRGTRLRHSILQRAFEGNWFRDMSKLMRLS